MTTIIRIAEFTIKDLIIKDGVVVTSFRMCDIGGQLTKEMRDEIRKELDKP